MDRQLSAVIALQWAKPNRRRQVRTVQVLAEAHEGGVGVSAISHADLVAGQERWRDMGGESKVAERLGAHEGFRHDAGGFRITRVGYVGLKIVFGQVVGIAYAPVYELNPG